MSSRNRKRVERYPLIPHHRRERRLTQNSGSLRVSDPKEHSENPWGVSLPLLGADVVVPQTRESDASMGRGGVILYGGLPDQNQQVSIVVVSAMLAVRWLEANADTSEQETAVPTPEQLSNVKMSRELDLFRTTCKVLRIPKAIERIWSRQRLMPWFRAVMTSWMYERAKRHMSRNTEAYQSFQLDIGPGAYKRAFLTH